MAEYLDIKNAIIGKIEALTGIKIAYGYEEAKTSGFPVAVITGFKVVDTPQDTVSAVREYTFTANIYQEIATTTEQKGEEIIDNLVDGLMNLFTMDYTLGGVCSGCWVSGGLAYTDREIECRVFKLEILAKKLVSACV